MLNLNFNINRFSNPGQLLVTGNNESFVQDGYQVIKFYYDSGSSVSGNGTGSFIIPDQKEVEFLVIGGGGSAGVPRTVGSYNFFDVQKQGGSAGGGAGTLVTGSFIALKGVRYDVVVGEGGQRQWGTSTNPSTDPGVNGAPSLLTGTSAEGALSIIAPGGGYGGSTTLNGASISTTNGNDGGSGGGAGLDIVTPGDFITLGNSGSAVAATVTGVLSYQSLQSAGGASVDGGGGANTEAYYGAGGGSSQVGGNGSMALTSGGNGGSGSFNAMSGSGQYFAGGGAGGYIKQNSQIAYFGLKGVGGGGGATADAQGGYLTITDGKGQEQTGGGGASGWSGGSGVIIVRYKLSGESL